MKQWKDTYQNMLMLTQFGLSLITPILMCLALCWWLTVHQGLESWVYIPGFFLGLGSAGMAAYKLYLSEVSRTNKYEKKEKISYNRHL